MNKDKQIVSKERVKVHGEVYTNQREVKAMMDLLNDKNLGIDATFLEPACGNGNFLEEILRRKLDLINPFNTDERIIRDGLIALSSIYAFDIIKDNVEASKLRILNKWFSSLVEVLCDGVDIHSIEAASIILNANIQNANSLTMHYESDASPVIVTDWHFSELAVGEHHTIINGVTTTEYNYSDLVLQSETPLLTPRCITKHYPSVSMLSMIKKPDFKLLEAFYATDSSVQEKTTTAV